LFCPALLLGIAAFHADAEFTLAVLIFLTATFAGLTLTIAALAVDLATCQPPAGPTGRHRHGNGNGKRERPKDEWAACLAGHKLTISSHAEPTRHEQRNERPAEGTCRLGYETFVTASLVSLAL
jgi:hypothetical protein